MTVAELLRAAETVGHVRSVFRFPYVHLIIESDQFVDKDEEEREFLLAETLGTSVDEIRRLSLSALILVRLLTNSESNRDYPASDHSQGHHWLEKLIWRDEPSDTREHQPRVVHFYGYKGGQARSTVLGILATILASDGWRVLCVDADVEAPSLDVIFSSATTQPAATLMGIVAGESEIAPQRVFTSPHREGYVDLLPCRPTSTEYDIETAAFALRSSLEPTVLQSAADRISKVVQQSYDVLLIDHRSGLSAGVVTWLEALRGPTVLCVRLDNQWRPARTFFKILFNSNPTNPGALVSFKSDDERQDAYVNRTAPQLDELLSLMATAVASGAESNGQLELDLDLGASDLRDHWIIWQYDPAFVQAVLPSLSAVSPQIVRAVQSLRTLLGVQEKKFGIKPAKVHPSGALDTAELIETDALRRLLAPNSTIGYIFGRKGTGKTRLFTELAKRSLGEPLVADHSANPLLGSPAAVFGIPSLDLLAAAELNKAQPIGFWLNLAWAALSAGTTRTPELLAQFQNLQKGPALDWPRLLGAHSVTKKKRIFLLDGLEVAFSPTLTFSYIEALFRFLAIWESDSRLASQAEFKLFLRTDLAERGYQNVEQQTFGRQMELSWDTQTIFNFVLSRMAQNKWYRETFPVLYAEIRDKWEDILTGTLEVPECERLLLIAFPYTLSRNNLLTTTFLKTYFADTASDRPDKFRYYPRIFDYFLSYIADPKTSNTGVGVHTPNGKIDQPKIFAAHEAAAREYLNQLKSELRYLLDLDSNGSENAMRIDQLLNAFEGIPTPFSIEECIDILDMKLHFGKAVIRTAMDRMKSVGMFEDRPGYEGQWRAGRLFKSSLRMKYRRRE
jgi:Mrp family chromosome partitioning ATPase